MTGSTPTIEVLRERLDRLERRNRRWRWATTALALGIAAVVLMGQARTAGRVVEAEEFVLRDPRGRIRGGMGTLPDGTAVLSLSDSDGKSSAGMLVHSDGRPELGVHDRDGKAGTTLSIGSDGTPGLVLFDREQKDRAVLDLQADGSPSLKLRDGKTSRAVLGHVALEATRTGAVEERPASSLVFFDRDGKVIWRAP